MVWLISCTQHQFIHARHFINHKKFTPSWCAELPAVQARAAAAAPAEHTPSRRTAAAPAHSCCQAAAGRLAPLVAPPPPLPQLSLPVHRLPVPLPCRRQECAAPHLHSIELQLQAGRSAPLWLLLLQLPHRTALARWQSGPALPRRAAGRLGPAVQPSSRPPRTPVHGMISRGAAVAVRGRVLGVVVCGGETKDGRGRGLQHVRPLQSHPAHTSIP